MENHDFLMQLFIIMWCGYFIMSCGFFIIWFVHRCDVVSSLCFVDFTSGTKLQHPGFTRYQQLVKPVLRRASVPALSRSCSLACEGKTSRRVFRRTSNSSLLFRNLLPNELSLKMYQSCPMTSLYVLVRLRSGIVIASVPFVLTPKKGSVYGCSCSQRTLGSFQRTQWQQQKGWTW